MQTIKARCMVVEYSPARAANEESMLDVGVYSLATQISKDGVVVVVVVADVAAPVESPQGPQLVGSAK